MAAIDYDTEFLEDGRTIALISIGMVADDGREYYAVNRRMPIRRIRKSPWLMANVVPSLPRAHGDARLYQPKRWLFNYSDPCVKPPHVIAREVRGFIEATPDPELWAWYAAYDHVALCQLWGAMVDKPAAVPMFTHDLKQECDRLGNPDLPSLPGVTEHNALGDARQGQFRRRWLAERAVTITNGPPLDQRDLGDYIREHYRSAGKPFPYGAGADGIQPG